MCRETASARRHSRPRDRRYPAFLATTQVRSLLVRFQPYSFRASCGGVRRWRGRRSSRSGCSRRFGRWLADDIVRLLQLANGGIYGRAFGILAERVGFAAFNAAAAKGALAGIVAPCEYAF